jgi:hypothetical protein
MIIFLGKLKVFACSESIVEDNNCGFYFGHSYSFYDRWTNENLNEVFLSQSNNVVLNILIQE